MSLSTNIKINKIDHVVLTVKDMNKTIDFYTSILGFELITFGKENRKALKFGSYKFNIHTLDKKFTPLAKNPSSGSLDICLISDTPLSDVVSFLHSKNVPIELGPIQRTGANKKIMSVYVRDPDENLIEIANEIND